MPKKYSISDEDLDDEILYEDNPSSSPGSDSAKHSQQQPHMDREEDIFDGREMLGGTGRDDIYGGGYETPMERHSDLLKDLTDFESYIKDTVNGWLGRYWDTQKGEYVNNPNSKAIMNEQCAVWCTTFLKTYARKNNIITNISHEEYKNIITDIIEVIWLNIGVRYKEFGIMDTGDILRICTEMQHAAELVLMGAGGGKYTQFLMGTYNQSESGNPMMDNKRMTMQNQKAGIVNRMKNWLWG